MGQNSGRNNKGKYMYESKDTYALFFMAIGMSVGYALGVYLFNNSALCMSIGMLMGVILGQGVHQKVSTTSDEFLEAMSMEFEDVKPYLKETKYIDFSDKAIQDKSNELLNAVNKEIEKNYPNEAECIIYLAKTIKAEDYKNEENTKLLAAKWIKEKNNDIKKKELNKFVKKVIEGLKEYKTEIVKTFYEFVRDEIPHSFDIESDEITIKASEVLKNKTGICYTKSNLLAAMLRYVGIPCGMCYEHLTLQEDEKMGYVVHCFNAVYLWDEWIFLDARGNKEGIDAQFVKDEIKLSFTPREEYDEYFYYGIFEDAHEETMKIIENSNTITEVMDNIPDEI